MDITPERGDMARIASMDGHFFSARPMPFGHTACARRYRCWRYAAFLILGKEGQWNKVQARTKKAAKNAALK